MKSYVNGLAKNRIKKSTGYFTGFLFLLIVMISGQKACAAVTVGEPGKTYSGEYVVIVNAGTETMPANLPKTNTTSGSVSEYREGAQRSFYTYSGNKMFTCIGSSEHCYIWMENKLKTSYDSMGKTQFIVKDMERTYEKGAWETLDKLSDGKMAYRDGSGKLSIALEQINGASGVYMGKGNEPDITAIHINAPSAAGYTSGSMQTTDALLVHEGQHALFEQFTEYNTSGKYMGITEGLSVAAMEYAWGNSDSSSWLGYISGNSAIKNGCAVLYRTYRDQSAQDYGLSYLFIRYLINRKEKGYDPVSFFHAAYSVKASGDAGTYLAAVMGENVKFEDLVTDFYTAIAENDLTGPYGFYGDGGVQSALRNYPLYEGKSVEEADLEPTAGIIVPLQKGETFTVPIDKADQIQYRIIGEKNSVLSPAEGSGTATDPYQIKTAKDWNLIANQPGAYYELCSDISFTGNSMITIGSFTGNLEGNGYTIRGVGHPLCIENKGTIQNVKLETAIRGAGRNDYGVLARENDGLISNCVVTGTIDMMMSAESSYVGTAFGIIAGRNNVAGKIQNCTVTASVRLSASPYVSRNGGMVGCNSGSVQNCYFKGKLQIEKNNDGKNCIVYAGGIAGEDNRDYGLGGSLRKCLNAGSISVTGGSAYVGQICGYVAANVTPAKNYISNCFGKSDTLSLVGLYGNTNSEQTELTDSKILTEEEWKNRTSFAGIDFDTDWKLGTDGPELKETTDITDIKVENAPATALVGEELSWWGNLKINASGSVTITSDMIVSFDNTTVGEKTVYLRYLGHNISYTIQVVEPTSIAELSLSGELKKKNYVEGEIFNPAGLTLVAKINGQYHYIKSGFTWSKEPLKQTDTAAVLNYFGTSVKTIITVKAKEAAKLEINAEQNRSYTTGSILDFSGIKLQITYSNGEKTDWFSSGQFERYQVHLAKQESGSQIYTSVAMSEILNTSDSGNTYYFYVGNILPGNNGTISCKLGTITIQSELKIDSEDIYISVGKSCYESLILSGSGSYSTEVLEEKLPSGISRTWMPDAYGSTFGYSGIASETGEYQSKYKVTDTTTKMTKIFTITIHVQATSEVQILSFNLMKAFNTGLSVDVTGKILDNQIILEVPESTDVSRLRPNIHYTMSEFSKCTPENGAEVDFSNPVYYTLTAPDGMTQRRYEVIVKKIKNSTANPDSGNHGESDEKPNSGNSGTSGQKPGSENDGISSDNAGTSDKTQGAGTISDPSQKPGNMPAAFVKLNATSLPLQVKKSTSVLKVKEWSVGDSVAGWSSSNKKVATVNAKTGKITAKKTGKATITVTMRSGATAKCLIKVQKGKVRTKKITLGKAAVTLKKGEKYRITWEKQPLTSDDKVSFASAKKKIASVSGKGVITAKKKGTTYVTVKSGSRKRKIKVTVR